MPKAFVPKPAHVPNLRAFAASLRRAAHEHSFRLVAEFAEQEAEDFKAAILAQDFQSFKDIPLSPAYAELKRRSGLDARTMIATKRYADHITVIERRSPGEPGKAVIYIGFDKADRVLDRHGRPTNFPLYRLAEAQEEGTDNIPARAHWRPWLEQMRERAKAVRKEIVKASIAEARRSL